MRSRGQRLVRLRWSGLDSSRWGSGFFGRLLLLWIPSEFGVHVVTVSPCLPTVSRHLTRAHKVVWAFEAISVQETVTGRELDTSI